MQRRKSDGPAPSTSDPATMPPQDEIARRAFELYEQRGCENGRDLEDWLEAERELIEERRESLVGV